MACMLTIAWRRPHTRPRRDAEPAGARRAGLEPVRLAVCAGANTLHAPESLTAYDPSPSPGGGWLGALRPRLQLSLGSPALRVAWANAGDCLPEWRAEPPRRARAAAP